MKVEKIKKYAIPALIFLFIIIITFFFYKDMVTKELVSVKYKIAYIIISIVLSLILLLIGIFVYKKKEIAPEKFFIIFGAILGIVYMFATPILKAHDEMYHWYKAYAVSELNFLPDYEKDGLIYDSLPENVQWLSDDTGVFYERNYVKTIKTALQLIFSDAIYGESTNKILVENTPTAYYPFIQMAPQAIGIAASRLLDGNILVQAYAGRLGNLIFFLISGYFAIKLLPNRKFILLVLLLSPKVMYISASLSGDVFTNGICILLFAYILNLVHTKRHIKIWEYFLLLFMIISVAVCKIVYIPLCFFILLIPTECFGKDNDDISKKKKIRYTILISFILIAIIIGFAWLSISSGYLGTSKPNSKLQVTYILTHPFEYCATLLRNIADNFVYYSLDMVGGWMQWGQMFELYPIISFGVFVLMFFAFFVEKDIFELKLWQKMFLGIFFLGIVVLILTSLYVQWNSVSTEDIGTSQINGVQGRYFTPIFMIIPFLFSNRLLEINKKVSSHGIYYGIIAITLPTILSIVVMNIL